MPVNINTLRRVKKFGMAAEIYSAGGSPHLRLTLPNGTQTGFESPPHPFESDKFSAATAHLSDPERVEFYESDASCAIAGRVLLALARHGSQIADAVKESRLSEAGRAEIGVTATAAAVVSIAGLYAELEVIGKRLDAEHRALYSPPAPDVAGTLIDVEVRSAFRFKGDQVELLTRLNEPSHERLLLALARAPLALDEPHQAWLTAAWTAHVAQHQPAAAAALTIAMENFGWAERLTKFIAGLLVSAATGSPLSRMNLYKLVKPTGGAAAFDFTQQETAHLDLRIEQAAA
jgi:hypothetical protein